VLSADPVDLGPFLMQIVVSLLSYLSSDEPFPKQALAILDYLMVEKCAKITKSCQDAVYLLPPNRSEFDRYRQKFPVEQTGQNAIRVLLGALTHEHWQLVVTGLKRLKDWLRQNQMLLYNMVCKDRPDRIVLDILQSLFRICRRCSLKQASGRGIVDLHECSLLSAECLGMIGAIDPSRIHDLHTRLDPAKAGSDGLMDDFRNWELKIVFILKLIQGPLLRAFRGAGDTKTQDRIAFVLQELCKVCGFQEAIDLHSGNGSKNTAARRKGELDMSFRKWSNLPSAVQDALKPFLHSKYFISLISRAPPSLSPYIPLYTRKATHKEWLHSFLLDVVASLDGPSKIVFDPCCVALRGTGDLELASWIFPHVVLSLLVRSSDHVPIRNAILQELLCPLQDSAGNEKMQLSSQVMMNNDERIDECSELLL
jgi:serine/threonine-protein kinase ATR